MWAVDTRKRFWVAFTQFLVQADDTVQVLIIPNDFNLYYQAALNRRYLESASLVPVSTTSHSQSVSARESKEAYVHIHYDTVERKITDGFPKKRMRRLSNGEYVMEDVKEPEPETKASVVIMVPKTLQELQKERAEMLWSVETHLDALGRTSGSLR